MRRAENQSGAERRSAQGNRRAVSDEYAGLAQGHGGLANIDVMDDTGKGNGPRRARDERAGPDICVDAEAAEQRENKPDTLILCMQALSGIRRIRCDSMR